jgi:hypothetical protein
MQANTYIDFDCSMRSVAVDVLLLAFAVTSSAHPPAPAPSRELLLEIANKARLPIWLLAQRYCPSLTSPTLSCARLSLRPLLPHLPPAVSSLFSPPFLLMIQVPFSAIVRILSVGHP